MTGRELTGLCLTWPDAYEDYPFGDEWAVLRHRGTHKIFAMVFEREGKLLMNLKCEPMQAEFWRKVHPQVTPGYHMNKTLWNTIDVNGGLEEETLRGMIDHSWELTAPRERRKSR